MRKMILIPYEQYQRGIEKKDCFQPIKQTFKTELFSETCIDDKTIEDLDRENEVQTSYREVIRGDITTMLPPPLSSSTRLDEQTVLQPFGKNEMRAAKTILNYINTYLNWNQYGELIINNETIVGSHITDLIKDALARHKRKPPLGYLEFYTHLKSLPSSLIYNKDRLKHIRTGRGNETEHIVRQPTSSKTHYTVANPPPPGLPINQPTRDLTEEEEILVKAWQTEK